MIFIKTDETGFNQTNTNNFGIKESVNQQNDGQLNSLNKLERIETPNSSWGFLDEGKKAEASIKQSIKSINDKFFKLLSSNNDLLYDIKNKIKNIPQKEEQLFSICWIIMWETEKYFKIRDKNFYENLLKPFLNEYTYCVNTAKQNLSNVKFYEAYSNLVENIENTAANEGGYVYLKLSNRLFRPIS